VHAIPWVLRRHPLGRVLPLVLHLQAAEAGVGPGKADQACTAQGRLAGLAIPGHGGQGLGPGVEGGGGGGGPCGARRRGPLTLQLALHLTLPLPLPRGRREEPGSASAAAAAAAAAGAEGAPCCGPCMWGGRRGPVAVSPAEAPWALPTAAGGQ